MPNIQPFAAFRYQLDQVGSLADVVAPPYDVIDETMQDDLYSRHPKNVVRLILNKQYPAADNETDNRYTRSAAFLKEWTADGTLFRENCNAVYVYHQIFTDETGRQHVRKGFLCRCEAVPFGQGMVFPHELTMSGPKLDRLMLTTACKMNFSPVFGLYPDDTNVVQTVLEEAIAAENLVPIEATDHLDVVHKMWTVTDTEVVSKVVAAMSQKPVFIADGHHRYETACNYRKQIAEMGVLTPEHPANFVLTMCVAMHDSGLIVQPTHRLFTEIPPLNTEQLREKIGDTFTVETLSTGTNTAAAATNGADGAAAAWNWVTTQNRQDCLAVCTTVDGQWHLVSLTESGRQRMEEVAANHHPEWRELGVSILHSLLIGDLLKPVGTPAPFEPKNTLYLHQVTEVAEAIRKSPSGYPLVALVMPATVEHIRTLSLLGERMPAKSTYFYPKLISGFVFHPLE